MPTDPKKPVEPAVGVDSFIRDASHNIGVSGLLSSDPELSEAELPLSEWQQRYDDYMSSPRP